MLRGRIVRVHADPSATFLAARAFDVGLEGESEAVAAVRISHPELMENQMSASERLSATAVAFLELEPGEVRSRLGSPAGDWHAERPAGGRDAYVAPRSVTPAGSLRAGQAKEDRSN